MSTFEPYDARRRSRSRAAAMATDAPLSAPQEMELAAEALEIYAEDELEEFVGNMLDGVATGAGQRIRTPVSRRLGGILRAIAPAGLPAGAELGTLMAPGPGTVVGSKLGWMIDKLLELELEGADPEVAELERARRYVDIVATSARHAALAPRDAPPSRVVRNALAEALSAHVPDLLDRALAGELSPYQHLAPYDPRDVGPGKHFTDAQKKRIIEENKKRSPDGKQVTSDDPKWDPYVLLTAPPRVPPMTYAIDHIIPRVAGGTNSYKNARVISSRYNILLGAKTDEPKVKRALTPRNVPEQIWQGQRKPLPKARARAASRP